MPTRAGPSAGAWGGAPGDVPVDLTREQARRLAEIELADPAYRAAGPSLLERAVTWVVEQVQRVIDEVGAAAPGGWLGILGLVLLIVLGVLFVRWRLGPVSGASTVTFVVDPGVAAAEYRARAAELAGAGRWDLAVTERMRALVRRCQERGLVDDRAGWTTDEVAQEVGRRVPAARSALARAAGVFDDVRYGGRTATRTSYEAVAAADDALERAEPAVVR